MIEEIKDVKPNYQDHGRVRRECEEALSRIHWTETYLGCALSSFSAHQRIADDTPFSSTVTLEKVFTNVKDSTFGIALSLIGSDVLVKAIDVSWFIC